MSRSQFTSIATLLPSLIVPFPLGLVPRGISLLSYSQSRSLTTVSGPTSPWANVTVRPRESRSFVQGHPPSEADQGEKICSSDYELRISGKIYVSAPYSFISLSMSSYFRIKPIIWPSLPDHKKTLEQLCKKPKK